MARKRAQHDAPAPWTAAVLCLLVMEAAVSGCSLRVFSCLFVALCRRRFMESVRVKENPTRPFVGANQGMLNRVRGNGLSVNPRPPPSHSAPGVEGRGRCQAGRGQTRVVPFAREKPGLEICSRPDPGHCWLFVHSAASRKKTCVVSQNFLP